MTNLARFDRSQPCPKCGSPERSVRWEPVTKDTPERLIVRCRCGFADQFAPVDGGATASTLEPEEMRRFARVDHDRNLRALRGALRIGELNS